MLQATATKTKGVVTKVALSLPDRTSRAAWGSAAQVVTLAEARAKANAARGLLAAGIDPLAQRKADRAEARAAEMRNATFRECLDGFLISHGDRWRAKHLTQWQNSMATYCKPLMGVAVADIEPAWCCVSLRANGSARPPRWIACDGASAKCSATRRCAACARRDRCHLMEKSSRQDAGGAARLGAGAAPSRAGLAEVPGLFQRLIATDSIPELCLALTILTATRSQEARGARWDEIDLKAKLWVVPPSRMKRKREHRVPLCNEAVKLIERLPRNGEHLFCINGNGKPIVAMRCARRCTVTAAAASPCTASAAPSVTGRRAHQHAARVLEVALAHAIGDATEAAYARGDLLEKRRRLMQQWATSSPRRPLSTARIIPLRRERRHG